MKRCIKALFCMLTLALSSQILANDIKCPSFDKVRSVNFTSAREVFSDWVAFSNPIDVDGVTWNVVTAISNPKIKNAKDAVQFAQDKITTFPLISPRTEKEDIYTECFYTKGYGEMDIVAVNPPMLDPNVVLKFKK